MRIIEQYGYVMFSNRIVSLYDLLNCQIRHLRGYKQGISLFQVSKVLCKLETIQGQEECKNNIASYKNNAAVTSSSAVFFCAYQNENRNSLFLKIFSLCKCPLLHLNMNKTPKPGHLQVQGAVFISPINLFQIYRE
jgi:hypothetical protein